MPAIGCKLPPKKAREMQVLTKDEPQRFLARTKEDGCYELFLLELGTGMRRGELMGLQWDDLNSQTGELHIVRRACEATEPHPEPIPRKIRKSGTGCLYQISDNLWEGSFFPRLPGGKRKKFNVYAETKEQCEIKLAEMIERVKAEIVEEKKRLKAE